MFNSTLICKKNDKVGETPKHHGFKGYPAKSGSTKDRFFFVEYIK